MATSGRPATATSVVVLLAALAVWWLNGSGGSDDEPDSAARARSTTSASGPTSYSPAPASSAPTASTPTATDATSGLPVVDLADLPPEASEVVMLIDRGGPFPYDKDGSTFGNYEGLLPDRPDGYYREYTVDTPGSDDRGARRIIGGDRGELYWTEDHYESFEVISR